MKILGITGPIGSGKSTVAAILVELGVPCYDCDRAAKALMTRDEDLRERIVAIFGAQAYVGGELNRAFLSERIFGDAHLRQLLEAEVHPAVARDFRRWAALRSVEWVAIESAILVESGFADLVDQVLFVTATPAVRLARVELRDGVTQQIVESRMAAQNSEPPICGRVVHVLVNEEMEALSEKVVAFHEKLTNFARN